MWQNALGSPIIHKGPYLLVYIHPEEPALSEAKGWPLSLSLSTVSHVSERAQGQGALRLATSLKRVPPHVAEALSVGKAEAQL